MKNSRMLTFTKSQFETYQWLKGQEINTNDQTLQYWAHRYSTQRIKEVVAFVKSRQQATGNIHNPGGWICHMLKNEITAISDTSHINCEYAKKFAKEKGWNDLIFCEKYVRDQVTGDDLWLGIATEEFSFALEKIYERGQLYGLDNINFTN